jgi:UDPglucose 6-dehydrogenase
VSLAKETGENPVLLASVLEVNESQPHRMIALLEKRVGTLAGKRIAVLGLAFKDNTDDIRDSRAVPVIQELVQKGARVTAYDPMANPHMEQLFPSLEYFSSAAGALTGADACLVMTEWPEFSALDREFDLMAHKVIIEGRRILSCGETDGICW